MPGSGTKEDPFRIENKKLGVDSKYVREFYTALDISNTNKYFIVKECTLYGGFSCIKISNVAANTAQIFDNQIFALIQFTSDYGRGGEGILIYDSIGINISYNQITKGQKSSEGFSGIFLENASSSIISSNEIWKMNKAIRIENSREVIVTRNGISAEFGTAPIAVIESINIEIMYNQLNYSRNGIYLDKCKFTNIENNTFMGMYCSDLDSRMAIVSALCENIQIVKNTIFEVQVGIWIRDGYNFTVSLNVVQYSSMYCVELVDNTNNCNIFHNSFIVGEEFSPYWSQAYDEGSNNLWYNSQLSEGNFWSDLGTDSTYVIGGPSNSIDLYPLTEPLI